MKKIQERLLIPFQPKDSFFIFLKAKISKYNLDCISNYLNPLQINSLAKKEA